ncbi:uncharacterized protein LOC129899993 isoform X5 [Solanum dulcamara]|uniref:uncharacterized protein LOC129899993 isoform X5 n=1 Tax=Solanum dulcamara TaxID=45834 RepID=UPI002486B753|nr:uncharacterized protein LOC129899993 isoform X5 [Solanum dulcamara]
MSILSSGMLGKVLVVLLVAGLAFPAFIPPPPRICGSPDGPTVTGPRIKLRDGRHLAYKEHGVPKGTAKYKVVYAHSFSSTRYDSAIAPLETLEELGAYVVSFDRPGYGESDPHPKRTIQTTALDMEELADQLGLGPKFYVMGYSMGGHSVWGCLKYIPNRLAGAALVAPVVNYWWPSFPANLSTEGYNLQLPQDQWALRVAHYAPWLVYWWNTQKWFPYNSVIAGKPKMSPPDLEVASRFAKHEYAVKQGVFESLHRDMMVGFGKWDFDPMDLKNLFPNGEGSVHLWHGDEDWVVPVILQRYVAERLPWIHYHEGPTVTGPRIKLRDGRHLAYKEHGVPKEKAKYKVVYAHSFGSTKYESVIAPLDTLEELGAYVVSFDRPGYGESDPLPERTIQTTALDMEELADQLGLGPKFYVMGFSMGGHSVWGCLKYIPNRLAGAALVAPVVNYWWPSFPDNLSTEGYNLQLPQDQWALRVAHYAPWLVYWWNTQKWFPCNSVISGKPKMSPPDLEVVSRSAKHASQMQKLKEYAVKQGVFESLHRDMMVGFGKWDFDPMDLKNLFPNGEGSVHLWHGDEDWVVPVILQRYVAERLPWIHFHEIPNVGHLLMHDPAMKEVIWKTFLPGEKEQIVHS